MFLDFSVGCFPPCPSPARPHLPLQSHRPACTHCTHSPRLPIIPCSCPSLSGLSFISPQLTLPHLQDGAQALPLPGRLPGPTFLPCAPDTLHYPCLQADGMLLCVLPEGHNLGVTRALQLASVSFCFGCWDARRPMLGFMGYTLLPRLTFLGLCLIFSRPLAFLPFSHLFLLSFCVAGNHPQVGVEGMTQAPEQTHRSYRKATDFYESHCITNRSHAFPGEAERRRVFPSQNVKCGWYLRATENKLLRLLPTTHLPLSLPFGICQEVTIKRLPTSRRASWLVSRARTSPVGGLAPRPERL